MAGAAPDPAAHGEPDQVRRPWSLMVLLSVAQFMVILDTTVVNVALPTIKVDLGFSEQSLPWVLNAYALVFGGFLLLGGRAADRLGLTRTQLYVRLRKYNLLQPASVVS